MTVESNHVRHTAYFTSAGLTLLAATLGWKLAGTKIAQLLPGAPKGTARKRMLACIIYITAAANRANHHVIEGTFLRVTGHPLAPDEAREAHDYLMRKNAPELPRILSGASDAERKRLLRAVVLTWSAHGLDSETSTKLTERIVTLLGFEQDAICETLDRLWLWDTANKGVRLTCRLAGKACVATYRLLRRGTLAAATFAAPHARQLGTRMLTTIQR